MPALLLLGALLALFAGSHGWRAQPRAAGGRRVLRRAAAGDATPAGVDGLYISDLDVDLSRRFIERAIWEGLDAEWMPLEDHKRLGKAAADAFAACVASDEPGSDEVAGVLMRVGADMMVVDFGESFVDAWTIANKVSDLLLLLLGGEMASCCGVTDAQRQLLQEMRDEAAAAAAPEASEAAPTVCSAETKALLEGKLRSSFERMQWMRRFLQLDGDEAQIMEEANAVVALLWGYGRSTEGGALVLTRPDGLQAAPRVSADADADADADAPDAFDAELPDFDDEMEGLRETVYVVVGEDEAEARRAGKFGDATFAARERAALWMLQKTFLDNGFQGA